MSVYEWQLPGQSQQQEVGRARHQEAPQPLGGGSAGTTSTLPSTLAVASLVALVLMGLVGALVRPAEWLIAGLALVPAVLAVATVLAAMIQVEARARVLSFVLAGVVALVALGAIVVVVVVSAVS